MFAGDSTVLPNAAPPAAQGGGGGEEEIGGFGGGSNSGDDQSNRGEDGGGDRMSYGGNRWPRQETLALLKIRSEMDAAFRDSSVKGPLWEEVSRKLAELGYHRNAKKCKEKFENVYKYHKRTKEGRTGKSEGKTYRFFDQLEAFGIGNSPQPAAPPPQQPPPAQKPQLAPMAVTTTLPWTNPPTISHATVPSATNHHQNIPDQMIDSPNPLSSSQPLNPYQNLVFPAANFQNVASHLFSSSTSSSTASDEEMQGGSRKRKRKWKGFFEKLTREVMKKQEELQRRFLETVEKREQERIAREEAWRMQEMARLNREHEILIQERTTAAAKDAALISFLQKISGQQIPIQTLNIPQSLPPLTAPPPAPLHLSAAAPPRPAQPPVTSPTPVITPAVTPTAIQPRPTATNSIVPAKRNHSETNNAVGASPSRWPKVEIEALIQLRTNLDIKYQENGPKGPLWEEISAEMQKLGYNRSSKRCKEKWENINKYFKKVKESSKKRPEDSKTCPYFHQLDALYREKSKNNGGNNNSINAVSSGQPLMVQPEQQWPLQQANQPLELNGRENMEEDEDEEDDEMDTEEEDGAEFQVVASKPFANTIAN